MYPYLFDILPSYGLLFATGTLVAWWWFARRGKQLGIAEHHLFNLCFYTLLGGILGAKAMLLAIDWRYYLGHPVEILGPFPLPGLLLGAALAAALVFALDAREHGLRLPRRRVPRLLGFTVLGGAVGAKLFLLLQDPALYWSDPDRLLGGLLRAAGVLIGGVLAGAVVFVLYGRRHGLPVLRLGDAIAAPLVLAQAIGRLGCFAAGCCYGKHAHPDNPFALVFTDPAATANTGVPLNVPLVPTQLIQLAADLVLAGLLTWLWRRRPEPAGTVFWLYMLLYGVSRGIIEFWRGDVQRGVFFDGAVSTSQLFSLAAVVFAIVMLLRGRVRRRETVTA